MLLDREKTIEIAVDLVKKAAEGGAGLVVFPEAFISGYPAWIWRLRPGGDWGISEAHNGVRAHISRILARTVL